MYSSGSESDYEVGMLSTPGTSAPRRRRVPPRKIIRWHKLRYADPSKEQYYAGDIFVGTSSNVFPEKWQFCYVNLETSPFANTLKVTFEDEFVAVIKVECTAALINAVIVSKLFDVQFWCVDGDITVKLFFVSLPLKDLSRTCVDSMKRVCGQLFDKPGSADMISHKKHIVSKDVDDIYDNLKDFQSDLTLPERSIDHTDLKPTLRPYQIEAVKWMLSREKENENLEILHPLFEEVQLKSGLTVFYNKYVGSIAIEKPLISNLSKGGILADEMGLGKTVEVLACILCNPAPQETAPNDLTNDNTLPTISKQPKSTKRLSDDGFSPYVDKPKKIKLTTSDAKTLKNKSAKRLALEMWYNSVLTSVNDPKKKGDEVRCVCGVQDTKDVVLCAQCSEAQHPQCMGFENTMGEYYCPDCWTNRPLLESKATLIVSPLALRSQWCEEICKHVGSNLKVFVYEGSNANPIYPTKLNEYDLVLTTYNILRADLRLTETGEKKQLRKASRYCNPGSPISQLKWWRLCLDEAQTVEVSSTMIATMANKIEAHHRWAITGTPISQDISDLYGLVCYLHLKPYDDLDTWNHLLYYPYLTGDTRPMFEFLSQVMWRSSKKQVFDQIDITPPIFHKTILEFSAIEKYYYQCEHESCSIDFLSKLRTYEPELLLSSLHKSTFKNLMNPLLTLRQACTHPGTTKGRYLASRKPVTTMKELLDALIERNKTDSEEKLRLIVSSINGLAGIYLLLNDSEKAVDEYRKVLQLAARFNREGVKMKLTVDTLQQIHTMHNLAEVMETVPNVQPTLRDDRLREDCRKLEEKHMEKYIGQNMVAYQESQNASQQVADLQEKFERNPNDWYTAIIDWIMEENLMSELNVRIDTLLDTCSNDRLKAASERRLQYQLVTWYDHINRLRAETHKVLHKMYVHKSEEGIEKITINDAVVQAAVDCHLRPQKNSKKKTCLVCSVSIKMREYETKLFDMTKAKKSQDDVDISNTGSWKASSEELILTTIYRLAKIKNFNADILKDGKNSFSVLKAIKNEFKLMRKFWTYLDQQVCAQDEIVMCKIRLSLKEPENQKKVRSKTESILKHLSTVLENKLEYVNMIGEFELEYQMSLLRMENVTNTTALEKNLGTHNYLDTLRNQQYSGQSPDPCPICKNALQDHWSILPCGHCYCLDCIHQLLHRPNLLNVTCCVCRTSHKVDDVSYIRVGNDDTLESNLKGVYSTKIEALLKLVIRLKNEDENVKILVFSTWDAILKTLNDALIANNVNSVCTLSYNFQKCLDSFKNASSKVTVLLLPVFMGAKGLNLTEASHVIFVEPLINPADELQAIGRVHRIGQTKQVHVHKFIIKNTIEENIHHAISANAENWDKNKLSIGELGNLFGEQLDAQPISLDQ